MPRNHASAKSAGRKFERQIVDYLARVLDDDRIDRRAKTGAKDRGDIGGLRIHGRRLVVELKDCARIALAKWIEEAHIEAGNDDALVGIVIHKRHGVGDPARQWVTMEVGDLVAIITGQHPDAILDRPVISKPKVPEPYCANSHHNSGFLCTRPIGHEGQHGYAGVYWS